MSGKNYQTVAIVGGTGELGKYITREFLSHNQLTVKVLTRKGGKNDEIKKEFSDNGAQIIEVNFDSEDSIINSLSDVEVLISTIGGADIYDPQVKLLNAAKKANIKLFIPSNFGSEVEGVNNPLFIPKANLQKEIEKSGISYIYYNNGFFIDHILTSFYGIDIKNRKATIIGKGDTELTVTKLTDIAKFVYHTFDLPAIKNKKVSIVGEITTLNKIVKDINEALNVNLEVEFEELDSAKAKLQDDSVDFVTKIGLFLRRDIEEGHVKLNGNDDHLVKDLKFTSVKEYIKNNFQ